MMNKEKLFTASLSEEDEKVEIHDIRRLFYVAFFGGIIPLVGLAAKLARQLKVDRKTIMLLAALGAVILIGKYAIAFTLFDGQPIMDRRTLSWIYKAGSCLLYLACYKVMKEKFAIHIGLGGEIKPILWDALAWILAGTLAEAGIAMFVSWLASIL
jgi:hypothetical protein